MTINNNKIFKKKYLRFILKIFILIISFILFKILVADLYYIPTGSMKNTINSSSYAVVSKISYGALLPNSTYEIPLISKISKKFPPKKLWDNARIYGFKDISINEIVLAKYKNVKIVKRIIGTPGDTIMIKNGVTIINSKQEKILDSYRYKYTGEFSKEEVKNLKTKTRLVFLGNELFDITLNGKVLKELGNKKMIAQSMNKNLISINQDSIFPKEMHKIWDENNYGALIIPYKGMKIELNKQNYSIYKEVIESYENVRIWSDESNYFIKENEVSTYTFKNDYFFLMGDNRMESTDSRFIGFIPRQKILGELIYWF